MFKRNTPAGEILRETAPRCKIEFLRLFELRQIRIEARALGQQTEDPALIEHVDVIFPHHVVDGRQFLAVAYQSGSQACDTVLHDAATLKGTGSESAKPAR